MAGTIDARLKELGIELPDAAAPLANYVPFVVAANLVFVSGQVPLEGGKVAVTGKVGSATSIEDGQKAARLCALNLLAHVKVACGGDLDKVKRVVKLMGFVNSQPDFFQHPTVINAASDVMVEVFGDAGCHARVALGAPGLPLDSAVEVDGIFEIG